MTISIADLHCDLLSYLAEKEGRSMEDKESRCCYSDLKKGGVCLQTLALFSQTQPRSVAFGKKQVEHFLALQNTDPTLLFLPAFENASVFADEEEPFDALIQRLDTYLKQLPSLFYISLTWDTENRFGGGSRSRVGLKSDGRRLLEYLHDKKVALDLSHASDPLAYEAIDWIDKQGLSLPLIASHSNFRSLAAQPRNLPEDLAKEIIRRGGLIGLNFFAPFIHETDPSALARHVEYGLSLGGHDALCFGADFFFFDEQSLEHLKEKYQRKTLVFESLRDASVYPFVLQLLKERAHLSIEQLHNIAYKNVFSFLKLKKNFTFFP